MAPPTPRLFPGATISLSIGFSLPASQGVWAARDIDRIDLRPRFYPTDTDEFVLQRQARDPEGDLSEFAFYLWEDLRRDIVPEVTDEIIQAEATRLATFEGWPMGLINRDGTHLNGTLVELLPVHTRTSSVPSSATRVIGRVLWETAGLPIIVGPADILAPPTTVRYTQMYLITNPGRTDSDGITQTTLPANFDRTTQLTIPAGEVTATLSARVIRRVFDAAITTPTDITLASAQEVLTVETNYSQELPDLRNASFRVTVLVGQAAQTLEYTLDSTSWANVSNTVVRFDLIRVFTNA